MAKSSNTINIVNRRASFEYHFLQVFEAGVILQGTEIKSIRAGNANLSDAYCYIKNEEIFIKNLHISEYSHGNLNNHEVRRERKLLLKKQEIRKLDRKVREKGFSLIPFRLFISERGFAKVEIALAKGKKEYDKRDSIKEKDNKRELDRIKKLNP